MTRVAQARAADPVHGGGGDPTRSAAVGRLVTAPAYLVRLTSCWSGTNSCEESEGTSLPCIMVE